ncbi:MAG: pyridoxamine 5'-phosphate oxidase family protein [Mobilitalea sp.]
MNQIAQFLNDCGTFYLATVENNQPHVRPFGAVMEWDGKTYICTNNTKKVYAQMLENPKIEISATLGDKWIRLIGNVATDPRLEAREAMLKAIPMLTTMYKLNDGIFEVLYFTDAKATIYSFTENPEEFSL